MITIRAHPNKQLERQRMKLNIHLLQNSANASEKLLSDFKMLFTLHKHSPTPIKSDITEISHYAGNSHWKSIEHLKQIAFFQGWSPWFLCRFTYYGDDVGRKHFSIQWKGIIFVLTRIELLRLQGLKKNCIILELREENIMKMGKFSSERGRRKLSNAIAHREWSNENSKHSSFQGESSMVFRKWRMSNLQ